MVDKFFGHLWLLAALSGAIFTILGNWSGTWSEIILCGFIAYLNFEIADLKTKLGGKKDEINQNNG